MRAVFLRAVYRRDRGSAGGEFIMTNPDIDDTADTIPSPPGIDADDARMIRELLARHDELEDEREPIVRRAAQGVHRDARALQTSHTSSGTMGSRLLRETFRRADIRESLLSRQSSEWKTG